MRTVAAFLEVASFTDLTGKQKKVRKISNSCRFFSTRYPSGTSTPGTQHHKDQVKVYAVEGTPAEFSSATPLSDLTVEDGPNSGRISVDSNDGLIQHHRSPSSNPTRIGVAGLASVGTSARETPLHFATEDTPAVFSRNDSLSSLSSGEDQGMKLIHV